MFDTIIPHMANGFSRMDDARIIQLEEHFGAHHYHRLGVVVRQALGYWLTDQKGRSYLDCLAAYSAANPGNHHPKIVAALIDALQGHYGSVISNVVYTDPLGIFLEKAADFIPQLAPRFGQNGNKVLPKNGGVESVETAIKTARIMDMVFQPGLDGSTYGGYPLACVAGVAALDVLVQENLAQRAAEQGRKLMERFREIASRLPHVKEVRGKGLFIGIEVRQGNAMHFCRQLLNLGVVVNDSHGHTIRISLPLIIDEKELAFLCERVEKVLLH